MTREEFYKLTDILNSEVLGNFMHGGEADELIAMFEEAVEHSNILKQKEPVNEDLNIESMIESYKQRLMSQSNGLRSPLIDMCLVSYKHGINETLDTLNLSNVLTTGKNCKEPKFKVGDRIKFKGVRNEDVTRVITNIQKGDGGGFRYLFADGSIYSIGDDGIELVEEPVSEELEEACEQLAENARKQKAETSSPFFSQADYKQGVIDGAQWQKAKDQSTIELAEDHAYFAGRTKTIEEIEEKLLSEVLPCFMHGGEADEVVAKLDEVLNQKK